MGYFKRVLLRALTLPGASAPFYPLMRGRATILMLHRFRDPELGTVGHDPEALRQSLAHLRRHRYPLLSLQELFNRLADGGVPTRAVAFTIDDGYLDHATVAAPIFAEFDCPVTTFLTTGFLDGLLWFWWDRVDYVFRHTDASEVTVQLGSERLVCATTGPAGRRAQLDLIERCKEVPETEKLAAIGRLASAAGVEVPDRPPSQYAPMSWDQARASERNGMTFGPHTVTHPVLSRISDDQSARELTDSWKRLRAELQYPVPVFCYPNGRLGDFGEREIAVLRSLGIAGGVVGVPGYAETARFRSSPEAPFVVPRFAYSGDLPALLQCVGGVERAKQILRGRSR